MRFAYIIVGVFAIYFIYSITVTEPPYGLNKTPAEVHEITLERVQNR